MISTLRADPVAATPSGSNPTPSLQEIVFRILGTPTAWSEEERPAPLSLSALHGHRGQPFGLPLPESWERCAGCNTPHGTDCSSIAFCLTCGEAWCAGCLLDKDLDMERQSCDGCRDLFKASTELRPCPASCKRANVRQSRRPACVNNIVLSWGALVVTTGDDCMNASADIMPDTWWGGGLLLPAHFVCYRRYWGSADRDPKKRINLRLTIASPTYPECPFLLVSSVGHKSITPPNVPGMVLQVAFWFSKFLTENGALCGLQELRSQRFSSPWEPRNLATRSRTRRRCWCSSESRRQLCSGIWK